MFTREQDHTSHWRRAGAVLPLNGCRVYVPSPVPFWGPWEKFKAPAGSRSSLSIRSCCNAIFKQFYLLKCLFS